MEFDVYHINVLDGVLSHTMKIIWIFFYSNVTDIFPNVPIKNKPTSVQINAWQLEHRRVLKSYKK